MRPSVPPLTLVVTGEAEPITIDVADDAMAVHLGHPASTPLVELEGDPHGIYQLLAGSSSSPTGVAIRGSDGAIERLHALIARVTDTPHGATKA